LNPKTEVSLQLLAGMDLVDHGFEGRLRGHLIGWPNVASASVGVVTKDTEFDIHPRAPCATREPWQELQFSWPITARRPPGRSVTANAATLLKPASRTS
jgi:hypothetical protein